MEEMFNKWASKIPAEIRAEVVAKLQRCEGADAILTLAEKYNLPMTEKTADILALYISNPKLLSEEELNSIAGGSDIKSWATCGDTLDNCSGGA